MEAPPTIFDSIAFHRMLLMDETRMRAYQSAITAQVDSSTVVLDVGTGTGILAMFAAQAGSRQVYAVDRSDIIELARELAVHNGLADRITFIKGDMRSITLPEQVDVIVSELIGKSLFGQAMVEVIADARRRYLRSGGVIIPQTVRLIAAPIEHLAAWEGNMFPSREKYALSFEPAERMAFNNLAARRVQPEELLAAGAVLHEYDAARDQATGCDAQAMFRMTRDGAVHALVLYFDATLADGIFITNAPPGIPSWDQNLLPLERPIQVRRGDELRVRIMASEFSNANVMWQWSIEHQGVRAEHSTFAGFPASLESLLGSAQRSNGSE